MKGKEPTFDGARLQAVRKWRGLSARDVKWMACSPGEHSDGQAHLATGGRQATQRGTHKIMSQRHSVTVLLDL